MEPVVATPTIKRASSVRLVRYQTDAPVDRYGTGVLLLDVKKRLQPNGGMIVQQPIHQQCGVAFASVFRVSNDCADFAKAGDGKTLAGHGNKFIVDANAVVRSHFVGSRTKKSWKS